MYQPLQLLFATLLACFLVGATALAQEAGTLDDGTAEIVLQVSTAPAPATADTPVSGMPAAGLQGDGELLFESGPFLTCNACADGEPGSQLQNSSLGMNILGFGNNQDAAEPLRLADQFEVPDPGWHVDHVQVFGYQTGSPPASSFTGVTIRIWDGAPGEPDSEVIFGDGDTNRMTDTDFTGIYRISETTIDHTRPIMVQTAAIDVFLEPGTYWLDWAQSGLLESGPWAHPITLTGECVTGAARRWLSVDEQPHEWHLVVDTNSECPQGMPFRVFGQLGVSGEPGPAAESLTVEAFPNPAAAGATVMLRLPSAAATSVAVYDMLGRQVEVLAAGELAAGEHEFRLESASLSSGIYVLRVTTGEQVHSQRITVVR